MPMRSRPFTAVLVLLVLALAGCKVTDFSLLGLIQTTGPEGSEHLLVGSVNDVAASLQLSLARFGFRAVATQDGEAVRIKSTTRNGRNFSLVLTRKQGTNEEWTHLRIEWENERDEGFLLELLAEAGKTKMK